MGYAIIATEPGGTDRMKRVDWTPPAPGPGQVLVRQTAVGVNFIDIYIRTGLYPWPVEKDLVLGCEGAGTVEALGEGVTGFAPGQRVAYTQPNFAYATHRLVPAAHLLALPESVSDAQAAASMLKGLTAYYLLHDSHAVSAGQTVLVHAAAGGVGLIAGQWLKALGVRAIGTAGGAEKVALAKANGYAEVIDYRAEDFVARVRDLTGGEGVHAVYDSVGRDTILGSAEALRTFGTLVSFGQSSGPPDQFRISHLARGSLRLTRPTLFHHTASRAWLEKAAGALFDMIGSGKVALRIEEMPLAETAAAHDALEGRRTTGSLVLRP
jgi:NADPH:quinone reductase